MADETILDTEEIPYNSDDQIIVNDKDEKQCIDGGDEEEEDEQHDDEEEEETLSLMQYDEQFAHVFQYHILSFCTAVTAINCAHVCTHWRRLVLSAYRQQINNFDRFNVDNTFGGNSSITEGSSRIKGLYRWEFFLTFNYYRFFFKAKTKNTSSTTTTKTTSTATSPFGVTLRSTGRSSSATSSSSPAGHSAPDARAFITQEEEEILSEWDFVKSSFSRGLRGLMDMYLILDSDASYIKPSDIHDIFSKIMRGFKDLKSFHLSMTNFSFNAFKNGMEEAACKRNKKLFHELCQDLRSLDLDILFRKDKGIPTHGASRGFDVDLGFLQEIQPRSTLRRLILKVGKNYMEGIYNEWFDASQSTFEQLNKLIFPELQSLSLLGVMWDPTAQGFEAIGNFVRSATKLHTFCLTGVYNIQQWFNTFIFTRGENDNDGNNDRLSSATDTTTSATTTSLADTLELVSLDMRIPCLSSKRYRTIIHTAHKILPEHLKDFSRIKSLRALRLCGGFDDTIPECLEVLAEACPQLVELRLKDFSLEAQPHIDYSRSSIVSSKEEADKYYFLSKEEEQLQQISATRQRIVENFIKRLPRNQLAVLCLENLRSTMQLLDDSVVVCAAIRSQQSLRTIVLSPCQVSDDALMALAECKKLERVQLTHGYKRNALLISTSVMERSCPSSITEAALAHLVRSCPNLYYLDIAGCENSISRPMYDKLKDTRRWKVFLPSIITSVAASSGTGTGDGGDGDGLSKVERIAIKYQTRINEREQQASSSRPLTRTNNVTPTTATATTTTTTSTFSLPITPTTTLGIDVKFARFAVDYYEMDV